MYLSISARDLHRISTWCSIILDYVIVRIELVWFNAKGTNSTELIWIFESEAWPSLTNSDLSFPTSSRDLIWKRGLTIQSSHFIAPSTTIPPPPPHINPQRCIFPQHDTYTHHYNSPHYPSPCTDTRHQELCRIVHHKEHVGAEVEEKSQELCEYHLGIHIHETLYGCCLLECEQNRVTWGKNFRELFKFNYSHNQRVSIG